MSNSNSKISSPQPVETAALILAAGGASRMGRPKALLPWGNTTLLGHCAAIALQTKCERAFLAVGAEAPAMIDEVADTTIEVIQHLAWDEGLGHTIAHATQFIRQLARSVVILLCDQPFVTPKLINELIARGRASEAGIAAAQYGQTVGPPVFFDERHFGALTRLTGDRGAKPLLDAHASQLSIVDFPQGAFDIDTPEDYEHALKLRAERGIDG